MYYPLKGTSMKKRRVTSATVAAFALSVVSLACVTTACADTAKEQVNESKEAANLVAQGGGSPAEVVTTPSGLKYKDKVVGKGAAPRPGQKVFVHYTGWLTNGQKFDSSRDRGQPFDFTLGAGQVIKGWDEGVASMKVGGRRELTVPPHLGYGARGFPGAIPPNSTLIFDVELLGIQ